MAVIMFSSPPLRCAVRTRRPAPSCLLAAAAVRRSCYQIKPPLQLRCYSTLPSSATQTYRQHPTARNDAGQLLSRVSGPNDVPLSQDTLGDFWKTLVDQHASRPALTVRHEPHDQHGSHSTRPHVAEASTDACIRWNYAQMDQHVRSLAAGMIQLGVRRGDRVTVLMMNNSAMASLQIATSLIGSVLVTLNPSYTAKELKRALNHVEAGYLFIVPSLRSSDYVDNLLSILPSLASTISSASTSSRGDPTLLHDPEVPSLRRVVLVDNLTRRPRGWGSESVLARAARGFGDAMARLHGRAIDYRELLVSDPPEVRDSTLDCHDVINLQLTSGTTGAPKAVALSSHNLLNNGIAIGRTLHFQPHDVLANIPPLFHCFGLTLGNMAAWSHGAHVVYPSEGFDAVRALRAASQERVTAMHGVPAHFIAELDVLRRVRAASRASAAAAAGESDDQDARRQWELLAERGVDRGDAETWRFDALRTGLTSGSTVPVELMRAIMNELGSREQTVVYGMTETSPVSFGVDTDADVARRCETVGRIYPHCHAKVVDPEDVEARPLAVGQVGELCVGGYVVMKGYFRDPQRTAEVLQRHAAEPDIVWMRTGDLAVLDEQGYAKICGRVKDLIIRGGENLTAPAIENCIDELRGVATSAVVAVPDERMGEAVGAFLGVSAVGAVAAEITPERVRAHVKEHLSGQCAPEWVWVLGREGVPETMPTTASGKVQKMILREWAKDLSAKGIGRATRRGNSSPLAQPPQSGAAGVRAYSTSALGASTRPRPSSTDRRALASRRQLFSLPDLSKLLPGGGGAGGSGDDQGTVRHREAKVLHFTPAQLYAIVSDVASYRQFVPYCVESRVQADDGRSGDGSGAATGATQLVSQTPASSSSPPTKRSVLGTLTVGYGALRESYTSRVEMVEGKSVSATALPSPLFKELHTIWTFSPVETAPSAIPQSPPSPSAPPTPRTRLEFSLRCAFANPLHAALASRLVGRMANEMVEAFERRAESLYGRGAH